MNAESLAVSPALYMRWQGQGICFVSSDIPLSLLMYKWVALSLLLENITSQEQRALYMYLHVRMFVYFLQTADGSSTHEKIDFWLSLPCSTFMIGRLSHRDTVTDLLSSGQLTKRKSILLDNVAEEFSQVCLQSANSLIQYNCDIMRLHWILKSVCKNSCS